MMRPCFCCCMFKHYVPVGEQLQGKATGFTHSVCWECFLDYRRNGNKWPELNGDQRVNRFLFIKAYKAKYRTKMREMFGPQRYKNRK